MIRRYDLGLNTRMPFIKTESFLKNYFSNMTELENETLELMIDVPVREYSSDSNLKVRLIGDLLVDRRYLEIEGERNDIANIVRELRNNDVSMRIMQYK